MYLLKQPVASSFECAEYARQRWINILDHESVYAMYLNDKLEVELFAQINTSNYRETNFNAREALKRAIFLNFDNVILFHNHTSGIALPSEVDKRVTCMLCRAYEAFDVHLLDHIIVTVNWHYSFADNHLLDFG